MSAKFQNISYKNNEDSTRYQLLYLGKCIDYVINSVVLLIMLAFAKFLIFGIFLRNVTLNSNISNGLADFSDTYIIL